jgi:hypothetical protein
VAYDNDATRAASLGRAAQGERLGGFVYGTIVVLAVVVAGSKTYPHSAGNIAVLVVVTSIVFWLAHVYAHGIAHSVARDRHLSLAALGTIARREGSLVEAAVPPAVALTLGALGVISTQAAVWAALALGLLVLAAQGVVVARIERLGVLGTVGLVAANLALGLVLVGLKLLVSH